MKIRNFLNSISMQIEFKIITETVNFQKFSGKLAIFRDIPR